MGDKKCIKCGEIRDISCFRIRKDTGKYRNSCLDYNKMYFDSYIINNKKRIFNRNGERNLRNSEANRARAKKWKQDNPDRVRINIEKENSKKRAKQQPKTKKS